MRTAKRIDQYVEPDRFRFYTMKRRQTPRDGVVVTVPRLDTVEATVKRLASKIKDGIEPSFKREPGSCFEVFVSYPEMYTDTAHIIVCMLSIKNESLQFTDKYMSYFDYSGHTRLESIQELADKRA